MPADRGEELTALMLTLPDVAVVRETDESRYPYTQSWVTAVSVPFDRAVYARNLLLEHGFVVLEESSLECQVHTQRQPVTVRAAQVAAVDLLAVIARPLGQWRTQVDPHVVRVAGGPVTLDALALMAWNDPVRLAARNRLHACVHDLLAQCPFGVLPEPTIVEHTAGVLLSDAMGSPAASLSALMHEVLSHAALVESAARLTPVRVTPLGQRDAPPARSQ